MGEIELEKKVELILEKLERIESLLLMEEVEPEEDELEVIREYLNRKKKGTLELQSLEEALKDV